MVTDSNIIIREVTEQLQSFKPTAFKKILCSNFIKY